MDTYYTLLDVPLGATDDMLAAAYQRQRERYSLERVAALGDEFQRVTEARLANLERAYAVLANPAQRQAYDQSIGIGARDRVNRRASRAGLSRREKLMALGAAVTALLVIAAVWMLGGRTAQPRLPPIAETNRPAPEFALPDLNGTTVRLSDYKGKIVMVNFWGTWCVPCKEETPALQRVHQKLRNQGLVIIGVDLRNQERKGAEGDADVRAFTNQYGVTYPIALDVAGDIARAFRIYPIPTSFFIDQTGTIRYIAVSKVTEVDVEAIFTRLQQEATAAR